MSTHTERSSLPALDGIRGLAILLVMLHHFDPLIPMGGVLQNFVKVVFSYGWAGVDLFFVLSGFLITGILIDSVKADNYFRAFYARRVLRIFPLYYSALIGILILGNFVPAASPVLPIPPDRKLYFLYLTNWLVLWKGHWGPNILGHFWSLAVEEQFYLVWPILVLVLPPRRLARFSLIACLVALLIRFYWVGHIGASQAVVMATITRMDSLLCGAFVAVLYRDPSFSRYRLLPWITLGSIAAFIVGVVRFRIVLADATPFFETGGYTLLGIGFAALILHATSTDGSKTLVQRVFCRGILTRTGRYSYGIYVYHVPLLWVYQQLTSHVLPPLWLLKNAFGFVSMAVLMALSFVTAKISYELFESRFLRLKAYFVPRYSVFSAGQNQAELQPTG